MERKFDRAPYLNHWCDKYIAVQVINVWVNILDRASEEYTVFQREQTSDWVAIQKADNMQFGNNKNSKGVTSVWKGFRDWMNLWGFLSNVVFIIFNLISPGVQVWLWRREGKENKHLRMWDGNRARKRIQFLSANICLLASS